jgi:NADP-dependent alcohol dehydrogenase
VTRFTKEEEEALADSIRLNDRLPGHLFTKLEFPVFSLLDPTDALTPPPRPLANGDFDAIITLYRPIPHRRGKPADGRLLDGDDQELVDIGPAVVKARSPLELRARLVVAAGFALNLIFGLEEVRKYNKRRS